MKFETAEAWVLGAIGLIKGLGAVAGREMGYRAYNSLRAVTPVDMEDFARYIGEVASDYNHIDTT